MTDIDFLIDQNLLRPSEPPRQSISEYCQEKRLLPPDTPFPGRWDNMRTPYAIEIINNMSPHSPIIHQSIMKGAQIGLTAAAENVLAYWMDESPAPLMLISATDDLLEEWANKRLEPLIDSCGFRHKIAAQIENKKSRRSGDKSKSKEFTGGFLLMASAQSPAKLRSNSIRILIRDEIDGAPRELRTGEGNWLNVSKARTNAWGPRKKIMDFSTPTLLETSAIYPEWEAGDRREFLVPCPHCKEKQKLEFDQLVPEYENNYLKTCRYKCKSCEELLGNHHKNYMLKNGEWVPTVKSSLPNYRSYHLSSLYSPVGMMSWTELYQEYLKIKDEPDGMRSFTNLYLGLPYRETGTRPKIEKIIQLRGRYKSGEVPSDVLFITAGADVQRGKKIYENLSDQDLDAEMERLNQEGKNIWLMGFPRLEMEVLGHGHGYRTFSIEYKVFYGHTHDADGGAWEKMREWINETGLIYTRQDGSKTAIQRVHIDSGDGERTSTVYDFCDQYQGFYPIKGDQILKKKLKELGDELTNRSYSKYSKTKVGDGQQLVTISTNHYKSLIYAALKVERVNTEEQRPRFMEFPLDYPDHYFKMLSAEERHIDGSFHAGGRRNEALDIRVYNLCAADVWLDEYVARIREEYVKKGAHRKQAEKLFTHRDLIGRLKASRVSEMKKK